MALNNKNLFLTNLEVEKFKINVPVDFVYGRNPSWLADGYLHSEKDDSMRHLAILGPWWGHLHSHKEGLEVSPEHESPEVSL